LFGVADKNGYDLKCSLAALRLAAVA